MTVSRVINGGENVRPATREAVERAIKELNYSPSLAARRLAGGGEVRIGLLYSNPSAAYLSEFLVGSLDETSKGDVQLVVEKCDVGPGEVKAVRQLLKNRVDGIILPPPLCDARKLITLIAAEDVPVVAVASGRPSAKVSAVSIDDFAAAKAMTEHVVALGHRRIGFIEGNSDQTASRRRREGYLAALTQAGLSVDADLIVPGLFTYRSGLDAAERLLNLPSPPTAIFASNDDMAAATVAVAHRRGLDVPGQITVCGFDDTVMATAIWPELTTVRQPIADMSRAAVELLVEEIAARRDGRVPAPKHLTMDFSLIHRETAAPPSSR